MHEMGIAQDLIRVALDYAAQHHAFRIVQFNIEMSAAAEPSEGSLRFYLQQLARGTPAENARVEIARLPQQAHCLACSGDFEWSAEATACPYCSSPRVQPVLHDEFRLASIDVD